MLFPELFAFASDLQTRIEMRQIGVRDEAKLWRIMALWQTGLLQHPSEQNAAGIHEDGEDSESHA